MSVLIFFERNDMKINVPNDNIVTFHDTYQKNGVKFLTTIMPLKRGSCHSKANLIDMKTH
jgi:hypothetical protein